MAQDGDLSQEIKGSRGIISLTTPDHFDAILQKQEHPKGQQELILQSSIIHGPNQRFLHNQTDKPDQEKSSAEAHQYQQDRRLISQTYDQPGGHESPDGVKGAMGQV